MILAFCFSPCFGRYDPWYYLLSPYIQIECFSMSDFCYLRTLLLPVYLLIVPTFFDPCHLFQFSFPCRFSSIVSYLLLIYARSVAVALSHPPLFAWHFVWSIYFVNFEYFILFLFVYFRFDFTLFPPSNVAEARLILGRNLFRDFIQPGWLTLPSGWVSGSVLWLPSVLPVAFH